jgi:hypothetical protein
MVQTRGVDSIPVEVIESFNLSDPFSCTRALGVTQPLREMNTRNIPGGKERLRPPWPVAKIALLVFSCMRPGNKRLLF